MDTAPDRLEQVGIERQTARGRGPALEDSRGEVTRFGIKVRRVFALAIPQIAVAAHAVAPVEFLAAFHVSRQVADVGFLGEGDRAGQRGQQNSSAHHLGARGACPHVSGSRPLFTDCCASHLHWGPPVSTPSCSRGGRFARAPRSDQKATSKPMRKLLVLKSRPVTGAAPRMRTRANSVCKARPTRLVMIGYQRKPTTPASVLP